jgi:hypothetical protein
MADDAVGRYPVAECYDGAIYDRSCAIFAGLPVPRTFDDVYPGTRFDHAPFCQCCGVAIERIAPTRRGLETYPHEWLNWENATCTDIGAARAYCAALSQSLQPVASFAWSNYVYEDGVRRRELIERGDPAGYVNGRDRHERLARSCDLAVYVFPSGEALVASVDDGLRGCVCYGMVSDMYGDATDRFGERLFTTLQRRHSIEKMPQPMQWNFAADFDVIPGEQYGLVRRPTPKPERELSLAPTQIISIEALRHLKPVAPVWGL